MKKKLVLPVKEIDIPQNNLPRVITGTKSKIVENYAEQMADGIKFPPIKVWKNGGPQWLVWDGVHRLSAAKAAGIETIDCEVYEFPENEFLLQAFSANLKHGLPLKRREKVEVTRTLYQSGHSVQEIAEKTGIPERTLQRWIKDLADEKKQERDKKIKQLHEQGYTQEEIAKEIGVTRTTVGRMCKNDTCRFCTLPEDTANNDQITEKEKQERNEKIKQLHEQGYTQEQIAEEIGITRQAVSSIIQEITNWQLFVLPENTTNNNQITEKEKQACSEKNRGSYEQEYTHSEIATMLGITKPDVGKTINTEDTQQSVEPLEIVINNNQNFVSDNQPASTENKGSYPEDTTQDKNTKPEIRYKDMSYDQKFALSRMPLKDCMKKGVRLSDWDLNIIRTLELIKADWSIQEIHKDTGFSLVEIRKAGVVMMTQYDKNLFYEKGRRWIANELQIDWKEVDFIWSLRHFKTALPDRFQLLRWLRESLQHNSDVVVKELMRIETLNQLCIQEGVETHDQLTEKKKYDILEKLPPEAKNYLQECADRFNALSEMFTYKQLQKEAFQELSNYYNQVVGIENKFRDFLIENGKKVL